MDVNPVDLPSFMQKNNVPNDAYFAGKPNGYDAYDSFLLCWDVTVPTTDADKQKSIRERFSTYAFAAIAEFLPKNGYKKVSMNSSDLRKFHEKYKLSVINTYDFYINKDFDALVEYYSLYYKKIEQ